MLDNFCWTSITKSVLFIIIIPGDHHIVWNWNMYTSIDGRVLEEYLFHQTGGKLQFAAGYTL